MTSKIKELLSKSKVPQGVGFADDEPQLKTTKGLRITNPAAPPPPYERKNISQNANAIISNDKIQKEIVWELTSRLVQMMKDKTLDENKNQPKREEEGAIIADFVDFALLINDDETKPLGYGTLSFTTALMKCLLSQRDRINELEHSIANLHKIKLE